MGRPREFVANEALTDAMRLFWLKGYEATSLKDLMEAMQLHKGSIYKAFGDKKNLFLLALKLYMDQGASAFDELSESASSPREAVRLFMRMSLRQCTSGQKIKGCFMMNTVVELAPHDEEIQAFIAAYMEKMRDNLCDLISRGQSLGQFRADLKAIDMADYLIYVKAGLFTGSKMNLKAQDPYMAAQFAVKALE